MTATTLTGLSRVTVGSTQRTVGRLGIALALAAGTVLTGPVAEARITRIVIDSTRSQSPTFEGRAFGAVGQYEKLRGTAFGELNPLDRHNAIITDIELAPRNGSGMVEYSTDIFILKPINLRNGNHRLFIDFNNRGQMRLGRLNDVDLSNNPTKASDAGTGFVMNLGYTVVSMGWDFGATGFDSMKISVPVATNPGGSAITGPSYEYIVFDNATSTSYTLTYPAATLDQSQAKLTVRQRLDDPPTTIPASGWEYTSAAGTAIRLLPKAPAATPFQQSAVYEFTYTAKNPVVAAIGLAAARDFVSFLRHATAAQGNPLAGDVQHTFSYSISQPSRALNDLHTLGFNEDEDGHRVIDGILSWTGGGSGDQINYRFSQTGRTERNRQNHLYPEGVFPFAHPVLTDHLSGKTGGRSERCTVSDTCPKRFDANSSNEYWVKAGSLLHTDTRGNDLKDPENVRFYLISGLSHGVGDITDRGVCQQFTNGVSPYAVHRALLIALDEWVSHGTPPPKSEVPRHSDKSASALPQPGSQTGVVPQEALEWPSIPGVTYNGLITTRYLLDFGPMFGDGIISNYPPSVAGRPAYPIFVSKVDQDGNEVAGIRLPPVEAPVATTTGWALRRAGFSENEGCESDGQNIPFAITKAERIATNDPRRSLEERYKNHEGYVKAVTKAAQKLEKARFLLPADVQTFIHEAENSAVLR